MAGPPRTDLRQYEELRPFTVEYDIATEATSSVILTQGKTKVSVSVYGPSQPRYLRHEEYDKCTVDVEYKANFTSSNANRSMIENDGIVMVKKMLENVLLLEQFPRMMIMVKVNILQDGGSLRSVVLNACTLAFSKSGIPMSCMPVSIEKCYGRNCVNESFCFPNFIMIRYRCLCPAFKLEINMSCWILCRRKRNHLSLCQSTISLLLLIVIVCRTPHQRDSSPLET
jgi:hypothetical protein